MGISKLIDYTPYVILGLLLLFLILAGLWWSTSSLIEMYDVEIKNLKNKMKEILTLCGYTESEYSLDIRRGEVFMTKDRDIIYVAFGGKTATDCNVIRRTIHELAHRLNKDSSEHGSMFKYIEGMFVQKALELGYITPDNVHVEFQCYTLWNQHIHSSEERFQHARMAYSLVNNPEF